MSTLTRKISSRETHFPVTGVVSATRDGGFIGQIEEEFVAVQSGGSAAGTLVVERGFLGSAKNAHPAGTTVTPVQLVVQTDAPTAPPPATAGGAAQTVSLLGPYTLNFDADGLTGNGTQMSPSAAIPTNAVIVAMWAIGGETQFALTGPVVLPDSTELAIGFGTADTAWSGVAHYNLGVGPLPEPTAFGNVEGAAWVGPPPQRQIAVALADCAIFVWMDNSNWGGEELVQGTADIYALIATPA